MEKINIPYQDTGYFSKLITNYIAKDSSLHDFYGNEFSIEGFRLQLKEKQFDSEKRSVLHQALIHQYNGVPKTNEVHNNIETLLSENTYTITTGHQLNLFTGPLYFIYKIISAIRLTQDLKDAYPDKNFVPVYWMASEDHDYDEMNHFNLFGTKIELKKNASGAVGRMVLQDIENVFSDLNELLAGRNGLDTFLKELERCYKNGLTITQATRSFVNYLFGSYGLVIVDGDDSALKREFSELMKEELLHNKNEKCINEVSSELEELGHKKQVNPRAINLFYLDTNIRERIILEEGVYKVLNTDLTFSKNELLELLDEHPERFSPNAVLRPLYQEHVLPNLAYIGGGGELAYWFQLKEMFKENKVVFPILVLRNSVLLIDKGAKKRMNKLDIQAGEIFAPHDQLVKSYLKAGSEMLLDLKAEERIIEDMYADIIEKAGNIDQSLQPMIKAELQKSIKALRNIEARLIKAEKKKEEVAVGQIRNLKDKLFPANSLQERKDNLLYGYLLFGEEFIPMLISRLNPFDQEFTILVDV